MKCITTCLVLIVAVAAISGRRVRRGYDDSERVISGSDHGQESDEQSASVSGEDVRECGGIVDKGYDNSPEVGYNQDEPLDLHAGHAYSKSSASASATSSSYNLNHKSNVIPV